MTLRELGEIVSTSYKNSLSKKNKIATGDLYNHTYEVEINNGHYIVYLNLPRYWEAVEYGRSPGKFPPVDAIRKWIEVKPLVPESRGYDKVPSVEQLAYLISRSIANNGIPASNVLEEALNDDNLSRAIDLFTDNLINGIYEIIKEF